MVRKLFRAFCFCLLTPLLFVSPFKAAAELKALDQIVAIVDEDVVLASELEGRIELVKDQYQQGGLRLPPDKVLSEQVLDRLIVDRIQLQMGKRAGIRVGDEELTEAIIEISKRNEFTSLEAFQQELVGRGIVYKNFREQVRQDIIIQEVQRHRLSRRIRVTPQELQNFLASPIGQNLTADEYMLGHILISVAEDASEDALQEAEKKVDDIHRQLKEDQSLFRELATQYSDGARALEGGILGWRKAAQLPALFAEAVLEMDVGDVLEPIRNSSGFHLVSLLDKKGVGKEKLRQYKTRHILVRPSEIRTAEETEDLIQDLYKKVKNGGDFGALAREYSNDPGTALAGGELDWIDEQGLAKEFAAQMVAAELKEVTKPFQTEFGWHILEVQDRRDQDISQEQRERKAMQHIRSRRFEEEFEGFIAEIRNNAYIEIK